MRAAAVMKVAIGVPVLLAAAAIAFVYSGIYPPGADDAHTRPVHWLLQTLRERSIARRAAGIEVPALGDARQLLEGGADYDDMCAGCHLKPGLTQSDLSIGLYPQPPNLAARADRHGHEHAADEDAGTRAARRFWIIKHGIKASGMPAWGASHDDARIWSMVAFLERLPELSPAQYQILTARGDAEAHEHAP